MSFHVATRTDQNIHFYTENILKIWMIDFTGFFHMMNPDHVAQSLSVALVLK